MSTKNKSIFTGIIQVTKCYYFKNQYKKLCKAAVQAAFTSL